MHIFDFFKARSPKKHKPKFGALDLMKYIGPGLLVTVGFIDPGNWASNLSSGGDFGYSLLWVITLSTIMLIILQHNVAHLGIATGLCLSEAATKYLKPWTSRFVLCTAIFASISTSLAEILGSAIALNMLFHIPIRLGAILAVIFAVIMLFTRSYRAIEKWVIGFVSIIGLSFLYELTLVNVNWPTAIKSSFVPSIPHGSMMLIMCLIGAVVMPHNLFLHSEVIQSRQWNLEDEKVIKRQLDFEFFDTIFSMIIGWAINCAMIILSAAVFYKVGAHVVELQQAKSLLSPLVGTNASFIFAIALLFAGVASTITSGIAAGSIYAGIFNEPFDIKDIHSKVGVLISYSVALIVVFIISNPFSGLIISQILLSIQLPITIFLQIYLTSSKAVMGKYKNTKFTRYLLISIGAVVIIFNVMLVYSLLIL